MASISVESAGGGSRVERELDAARRQLLDLTARNRLLHYRPRKNLDIEVIDESPREVYDLLVLQEKAMDFLAAPEPAPTDAVAKDATAKRAAKAGTAAETAAAARAGADREAGKALGSAEDASAPVGADDDGDGGADPEEATPRSAAETHRLWAPPDPEVETPERHTDRHLQTPYGPEALQKRLFKLDKESRAIFEEQGYTVLYLALGMLHWRDPKNPDAPRYAPLLLLPVELRRTRVRSAYRVAWTGEELAANISLQAKLAEQGIPLPDFETPEEASGVGAYFAAVLAALEAAPTHPGGPEAWALTREIHLGLFSFAKFVMYRDLDPAAWSADGASPAEHPLLRAVLDPVSPYDAPGRAPIPDFDEDRIDELLPPASVYHVLDADPSQIAVIEEIKAGRNLVVEGPPGTGKSQTIANAIGELLAQGKRVLFVSEKMAALEVVQARLEKVGLGDFVLELHSRKTKKRAVIDELARCLEAAPPTAPDPAEAFADLAARRAGLNAYVRALAEPVGNSGLSVADLFARKEAARAALSAEARAGEATVALSGLATATNDELRAAEGAVSSWAEAMEIVGPPGRHPWRGCEPGTILPADEQAIREALGACAQATTILKRMVEEEGARLGVALAGGVAETEAFGTRLALLAEAPTLSRAALTGVTWRTGRRKVERLLELVEHYQRADEEARSRFRDEALGWTDLADDLRAFEEMAGSWLRIFFGRYRALRRRFADAYRDRAPSSNEAMIAHLRVLATRADLRRRLDLEEDLGIELFEQAWRGPESDLPALRRIAEQVPALAEAHRRGDLLDAALAQIEAGVSRAAILETGKTLHALQARLTDDLDALAERLGYRPCVEDPKADAGSQAASDSRCASAGALPRLDFDELTAILARWTEAIPALQPWARYVRMRAAVAESLAAPLIPYAEARVAGAGGHPEGGPGASAGMGPVAGAGTGPDASAGPGSGDSLATYGRLGEDVSTNASPPLTPTALPELWRASLADGLLRIAFAARAPLADFVGGLHEKAAAGFIAADETSLLLNRPRLAARLHERRPRILQGAPPASEAGILLGQIHRKRGHMPIRQLLGHAGGLIQGLKPCFMMSPISIAQFLDPRTTHFDVILFDEASQVRPGDALGALLRGKQLAVFGDTKQLPPTAFFEHVGEAEEDDDPATGLEQVESILHKCGMSFAKRMLRHHYRSRHESLIAVANQQFYGDRLRVYPSPVRRSDQLGVQLLHDPSTVYDRGKGSINSLEAKAVAAFALDHARTHPEESLGVGAFSTRQQRAIWEEVELLLRTENPGEAVEAFFAPDRPEHFFVKNLETIQGDERDVILISVGYGFDGSGRLSKNFGPLNQEGGERRLNVLITRARRRCVVFANFTADDLDVGPGDALALQALKAYLRHARRRAVEGDGDSDGDSDAGRGGGGAGAAVLPLSAAIRARLVAAGHETRARIGCAEFRVDLAVVDPDDPGAYRAGILLDGPTYYRTPVARERERLRRQVLGRLGWRLHFVWSPDWYRNPEAAFERLRAALEAPSTPSSPPAASAVAPASATTTGAVTGAAGGADSATAGAPLVTTLDDLFAPYVTCAKAGVRAGEDVAELTPAKVAKAVAAIVAVEGPVHEHDVLYRLRDLSDASRVTPRMQEAVAAGIDHAAASGAIRREGPFCLGPGEEGSGITGVGGASGASGHGPGSALPPETPPGAPGGARPVPRRRAEASAAEVEYLYGPEIEAGLLSMAAVLHAADEADLLKQTAKAMGFPVMTSALEARFADACAACLRAGLLHRDDLGRLRPAP